MSPHARASESDIGSSADLDARKRARADAPSAASVLMHRPDGAASRVTPEQALFLQRTAGNAAVGAGLGRRAAPDRRAYPVPRAETPATVFRQGGIGGFFKRIRQRISPEKKKDKAEHPPPPKLPMDLASGEAVLKGSFEKIKTIVPGKIEVLEPAAFKEAYDKVYGGGQYSWDNYIIPTYGGLNGFAHEGTNYINKGSAGLHTIVHEMLHNNTAADWRGVVGSRWDEGTTEVLTQEACAKFKVDAPVTYPGESPVVREAMGSGLPLENLSTAYLAGGAKEKIADWVDANCKENWAAVKGYMEAKNWAAAKAAVAKKA